MEEQLHYSILIEWSEEDRAFVVRLPDWERAGIVFGAVTHGHTYDEAIRNAQEALDSLVGSMVEEGEELPAPGVFAGVAGHW